MKLLEVFADVHGNSHTDEFVYTEVGVFVCYVQAKEVIKKLEEAPPAY